MEIILKYPKAKKLPPIPVNEREFRPYQSFSNILIKRLLASRKRCVNNVTRKVLIVMEIVSLEKELLIRNHPDYEQYHKEWLVQYKVITRIWDKENQEREKWIDIKIAKLQKERAEIRNPKY